jgi:neutral ceramidase
MTVPTQFHAVLLLVFILGVSAEPTFALEAGTLRVGTVKVDITPDDPAGLTNLYQTPFTGIHDRTYARGIVLDNGVTSAAIIALDTVEITDGTAMVAHISRETGIPTSNIIMAATHDHQAPMISLQNANGSWKAGPAAAAFVTKVENDLVAALKQARSSEQPARIGIGRGTADVSVNRDFLTPEGTYKLGRNPDGPSDKTVWVVKFETPTGEPIALLINYAVHGTVLGAKTSLLSGELPGATSRFVEDHYNGKVVAVWTSGAAGDQAPIVYMPDSKQPNADRNFAVIDVLGQILGTEAIRVADTMKDTNSQVKLWGSEKTVTCPGQKVVGNGPGGGPAGGERKILDADPVNFRLSLLMIDQTAIASISSEVVSNIYQRLRKESPFPNTILITLANGRIGYIPEDASYANPTFEVYASPLKKGCGESTIVNGLLGMMKQY